jgi:hypothetical protein
MYSAHHRSPVRWLAACSKPATQAGRHAGQDGRQIRLAEPAPADRAVGSDLEAHQPAKPILVRRAGPARAAPSQAVRVAAEVAEPQPSVMNMTASSMAEPLPAAGLSPAPEAKAIGFGGSIGHGLGSFSLPANDAQTLSGGTQGPMIMIRGGMGGVDDKCDTRGAHRGGIAINRMTPFGSDRRGGIR